MDYRDLTQRLVRLCLKKGADLAEVYCEIGRNLSIEVRNGEVETVQEASGKGIGFRVFVQGRMGFASSNDLSEASLDGAMASAVEFARSMTADPNNVLPEDPAVAAIEGLYDPSIAAVPMADKLQLAKSVEKLAMKDPRITKSAGSSYSEAESEVFLSNSHGLLKSYKSSSCAFGVSVVAEKGEQKCSGGEYCSRRFFADLKPAEEVAAKAAGDAIEMLDPRMVKTQRAPVVFHPDVAYALLGGILSALGGERVLQGASFLAQSLGKMIGSELMTLIDDGLRPRGLGSRPFDGEGVHTQKRVVVEKGVLRGFFYNSIAAKRAGVKSTGNASRDGFASLPEIGPNNFYLAPGTSSPQDILGLTKTGLWLKEVTGYGINPVTGNFSGGASGLWIEGGRVAFPVKGLTIAGTAAEIFNGLDMLADDLDLNRIVATPTFRIASLQIGGE